MAGNSESYHEPYELLTSRTREMHRAIVSAMEELEAIDWYQQRADASEDEELEAILLHNMREEMEHAAMTLAWIRRRSADFDGFLRQYLDAGDSGGGEGAAEEEGSGGSPAAGSLGIGSLRERS